MQELEVQADCTLRVPEFVAPGLLLAFVVFGVRSSAVREESVNPSEVRECIYVLLC